MSNNGVLLGEKFGNKSNDHSAIITVLIKELLQDANKKPHDISAVSVSAGPGSYTGLRIGVSTAKGICHGLNIPLIGINTLRIMAAGLKEKFADRNLLFCPLIDARRMEVYAAIYDAKNKVVTEPFSVVIDHNPFGEFLQQHPIVFFGSGLEKCVPFLASQNAVLYGGFQVCARHQIHPALTDMQGKKFADTAYFEPEYLKPFYSKHQVR